MNTFQAIEKKTVTVSKTIDVVSSQLINPNHNLDGLRCNACHDEIGQARPIAIAWDGKRAWRLCNKCASGLETKKGEK